jgi:Flp pilus assembly protein TadD
MAQLALRTGEAPKAIPLLRHALAVQPGNSEALLAMAQAWDAVGDPARAEDAYRRLIALQPGYWAGYSKLAGFYFAHGRYGDAATMFRRVTELAPDSAVAFSNLGGALQMSGDPDGALGAFRHSVALEETAPAVANLGTLQFYLGRFDEAAASFERATRLAPASFEVWMNLGDAYRWSTSRKGEAAGAYGKAIELAQQQLAVNPTNDALRPRLAMALAKNGDLSGADRELRLALSVQGTAEALYAAGLVAAIAGRKDEAVSLLQRAVAAGYDRDLLARDPELSSLRDRVDFSNLLRRGGAAA